ncbi:MAG TPA: cupredoxin domain-containing protein [Thermoleophilaceae bacterium]
MATGLLALAGCGGDDNSGGSSGSKNEEGPSTLTTHAKTSTAPEPVAGKPATTLTVAETEYKLDPSKLNVASKGTVQFDVQNNGKIVHALEVEGPGGETRSGTIQPGQSKQFKVSLDKPGSYEIYCPIGNHRALGMKGTLRVGS